MDGGVLARRNDLPHHLTFAPYEIKSGARNPRMLLLKETLQVGEAK